MVEKVRAYMERQGMLPENGNIVAGVSGGADSVCLLWVLMKLREQLKLTLSVVHVDHGLRTEAAADAEFVRELCSQAEIPFVLCRADVAKIAREKGISCEEAGRNVRYRAFEEQLNRIDALTGGHGCIAVAHNRDDRAETLLFHLFRGTGLDGMAGIRPVRPAGTGGRIIRPLLETGREEIEAFLRSEKLSWRTDATNAQEMYARNRIRNRILPYAEEEICAGAKEHLAREAALLEETGDYVREQMLAALERCVMEKGEAEPPAEREADGQECRAGRQEREAGGQECRAGGQEREADGQECRTGRQEREAGGQERGGALCLSVTALQREAPFLRKLCVRECMQRAGRARDLSSAHVEAVCRLASESQSGRYVSLPALGIKVVREFDALAFYSWDQAQGSDEAGNVAEDIAVKPGILQVPGLGRVHVRIFSADAALFLENIPEKKYTKWFDYDKIKKSATFRARRTGDYLTINAALDKKSLKRYMIDEKIPASKRDRLWVLADGEHVMWVPGYRISAGYKVTAETANILEICCERDCETGCGTDA